MRHFLLQRCLRTCGSAAPDRGNCAGQRSPTWIGCVITLKEHKTARKTGQPRRIPIGRKLGQLLDQAIGQRTEGPVFLSPSGKPWKLANLSRTLKNGDWLRVTPKILEEIACREVPVPLFQPRLRDVAGLPRDLVLYLARHECGTKICREKGIE